MDHPARRWDDVWRRTSSRGLRFLPPPDRTDVVSLLVVAYFLPLLQHLRQTSEGLVRAADCHLRDERLISWAAKAFY